MIRTRTFKYLAILLIAAPVGMTLHAAGLTPDYEVLSRKNIFSKNRISFSHDDGRTRNRTTRQRRVYTPVLIGSMLEDDGFVAFIVDPESHDITTVRAGDILPSGAGTLKEATLDYIITDPGNGKPPMRVVMGQNILGGIAEYPDPAADAAADSDAGSTTQPANTGGSTAGSPVSSENPSVGAPAGPALSGSVQDIAARLRAKRLQQLGK